MKKLQNIIALLHLSITYLSTTYFIWCMTRYTMRRARVLSKVTRSTKLRGAQCFPELGFRNTDFRAPENLIFPALSWHIESLINNFAGVNPKFFNSSDFPFKLFLLKSFPGSAGRDCFDMLKSIEFGDLVRLFESSRRSDRIYLGWFVRDLVGRLFKM